MSTDHVMRVDNQLLRASSGAYRRRAAGVHAASEGSGASECAVPCVCACLCVYVAGEARRELWEYCRAIVWSVAARRSNHTSCAGESCGLSLRPV